MQRITLPVFVAISFIFNFTQAQGNDCATAAVLTPGTSCTPVTGSTLGATQSIPAITCGIFTGNADDDVWYRFTATATAHTITVSGNAVFDAVVELRSGACNGSSMICADETYSGGTETINATGLAIGSTYYIRIYSYGGSGSQGTFTICLTTPTTSGNDNCAGATVLSVSAGATCTAPATGTTIGATQSQVGCSGTADDDVWFRFTATGPTHTVTVTPGTLSDAVFQVFSGGCGALSAITCIDNSYGSAIETTTLSGLTTGATYFVRVYSWSSGSGRGTFSICVTTPATMTNDNCSGAVSLTVNPSSACTVSTSGTTAGATQSQTGCSGSADDDVWYRFTATGTTHTITVTPGTLYDAVFQVFAGSCAGLTNLACVDGTLGSSIETTTLSGLTAGTTYYVRVYSWYNSSYDVGTFTICVTTPITPANDNCSGAIALTVNPTESCTTSTTGTTSNATQSMVGCMGFADDDVWYSFVATSATHTLTTTGITLYDPVMEVFSGSCGSLTSVACIDNSIGVGAESQTLTGLTVGATYYIRIYSYYSYTGDAGTFTICVTSSVPCTSGPGTGVTDLGCPSVMSGGLGLNGADPDPVDCTTGSCVDLEATYLQLGRTTDYVVESIPYAPPYQFECLANPVSVNVDDVWSPVVNLPFDFCFYGNTYNRCLISSNGVITFDTASNTPGGTSTWSFSTNVPSSSLFLNSIFGVYHDIDPSIGGEVGWELITLNTGCRALVAAWSNIPMYSISCNSMRYTGMIVLYENTNIIDVYIQQKNVCSSWNGGNAIVGLQNATGTIGLAAPGRNALDPDWTVTNEAWRFIPSGDSITQIQWFEGAEASGPVIGTTDVISVCPSETTVYTAQVTYTLCNGITLQETESTTVTIDRDKVWNGSVSTNWNTPANWTPPGVPTAMNCVVIPDVANDCIISGTGYQGYAYSITVLSGGSLTVNPNNNLTVTNSVDVGTGGNFNIMNSASLIQIDDVANSGIINMQRITQPMYRYDFTYWGSPLTLGSGFTLGQLSPNTLADKYFSWNPSQGGSNGIWVDETTASVMTPGKGYIVRAPQSFSTNPSVKAPYTANFIGTPNNGNISSVIGYGSMGPAAHEDKWNLLGNPYPSAVSAALFLDHPANAALLDGTIYLYTHNTPWSTAFPDPFYGDYVINYTASDYASWNKTGGVGTVASTGGPAPNGYIAAGQAFFVQSLAVPGSAVWTNGMRVTNNNTQFFRTMEDFSELIPGETAIERHRIWLNLTNENGSFNQLLVGYVQGATYGWDRGLDGIRFSDSDITFYSIIPGEKLVIQARPLPFQAKDRVPLGYTSATSGTFAIKIDHVDGLFHDRKIYLEDKLFNIVHDLKQAPYTFTTQPGTFDNRFVLRYTTIKSGTPVLSVAGMITNNLISIQASDRIQKIEVHDVAGKLVRTYLAGNSNSFEGDFFYDEGIYFAEIETTNGSRTVKLINQR